MGFPFSGGNKHETYECFVRDIILRTDVGKIGLDPEDIFLLKKASRLFNFDGMMPI
jgi:hypothetical protein